MQTKKFTYDYDGRLLALEKVKKKKLPAIYPLTSHETNVEKIKMNADFFT